MRFRTRGSELIGGGLAEESPDVETEAESRRRILEEDGQVRFKGNGIRYEPRGDVHKRSRIYGVWKILSQCLDWRSEPQDTGGLRPVHGRARSNAADAASTVSSSNFRPII